MRVRDSSSPSPLPWPLLPRLQDLSPESLVSTVETYESRPLSLLIYSSKRQETRAVTLVPSRSWSTAAHAGAPKPAKGHGRQESEMSDGGASLLGLSLRFCTPEKALENVWHVLEILEDSPAESAGASRPPTPSPSHAVRHDRRRTE